MIFAQWRLGTTRVWPWLIGPISKKAYTFRSSYIFVEGMVPFMILQNKQSSDEDAIKFIECATNRVLLL